MALFEGERKAMRSMPEHAFTAAPGTAPAVDRAAADIPHQNSAKPSGRGSHAALLIVITAIAVLGAAGAASWYAFFSPVTVSAAPVEAGVPVRVFGLGTIGARVQSNVGFKVAGLLVELAADQGDRVRAGQVLARLDARDVEAQLALAKAGVGQARANVDKAKADAATASVNLANATAIAARRAALVRNAATSVEEAQTADAAARIAEASLTSAQSAVTVAEAALKSAEAQQAFEEATLSYYTLYAPYDAWVVSRNLELGSAFSPGSAGQSVFTLVAAHTVWAVAYVDERLAGNLSVGQSADIILRSDRNARIAGHVERIEIQSDAVNEERIVDVAFDQVPDAIHLAEQTEVIIAAGSLPRAVMVQAAAVFDQHPGRGVVWTVEDGRLQQREVKLGPEMLDGRIAILEGLPAGAVAVAKPVPGLSTGRAVRIAPEARR
jgi:HlyD family secretion protein